MDDDHHLADALDGRGSGTPDLPREHDGARDGQRSGRRGGRPTEQRPGRCAGQRVGGVRLGDTVRQRWWAAASLWLPLLVLIGAATVLLPIAPAEIGTHWSWGRSGPDAFASPVGLLVELGVTALVCAVLGTVTTTRIGDVRTARLTAIVAGLIGGVVTTTWIGLVLAASSTTDVTATPVGVALVVSVLGACWAVVPAAVVRAGGGDVGGAAAGGVDAGDGAARGVDAGGAAAGGAGAGGAVAGGLVAGGVGADGPSASGPRVCDAGRRGIDVGASRTWTGHVGSSRFAMAGATAAIVAVAVAVVLAVLPDARLDDWWPPLFVVLVAGGSVAVIGRARITIDATGLRLHSEATGVRLMRVPLHEVAGVTAGHVSPGDWGGWGLRVRGRGTAFVVRSGPGIVVTTTRGRLRVISHAAPAEPVTVLRALVAQESDAPAAEHPV